MTAAIQISFPNSDLRRLRSSMERNARDLGKSVRQSVKFAAWAVAESLRLATKIAPKHRAIEPTGKVTSSGNKEFSVTSDRGAKSKTFNVYAPNKRAAQKLPQVTIARRGLAASLWGKTQSKLGRRGRSASVNGKTDSLASRLGSVQQKLSGDNPAIIITNRANYAMDAFKTSGEQTVGNAIERASRRMEHMIDADVRKKMGAK